ncbi:MAG TPA: hypothetical protein VF157_14825, partial [Chloroflexota bacterium]
MPLFPPFPYATALALLAPVVLAACGGQASAPPSASVSPAAAVSAKPAAGSQAPAQTRPVKLAWATQTSEFLPPQVGL